MIDETPEMQAQRERERRQQQAQQPATRGQQADTLGDALGPVVNLEKSDLHFWATIAQLVVLVLILRELRGGAA